MEPISILFVGFETVTPTQSRIVSAAPGARLRGAVRPPHWPPHGRPFGSPQKPPICEGLAQHHRGYQLGLPEGICEMVE